jgi:transcriptional regulator with XRE-family HTH domain
VLPNEIREVRDKLGLKQVQMGNLMNVHPVTISRWENGKDSPSAYQGALLRAFQQALHGNPELGADVGRVLLGFGVAAALFFILRRAFQNTAFE